MGREALLVFMLLLKFNFSKCEIGNNHALDNDLELEDGHHYLNRSARHFSAHRRTSECGFRCGDGTCVKSNNKCDGTVQCGDASDETDCVCLDRIGSKKICDGLEDCPNGEDEMGCGLGCQEYEISCTTSKTSITSHCIKISQRCDGMVDCFPNGNDEKECFRLSTLDHKTRGVVSSGVLQKRMGNDWHSICQAFSSVEQQLLVKYSKKTCDILVGHIHEDPKLGTVSVTNFQAVKNLTFLKLVDKESKFNISKSCDSGQLYHVTCPEPECGWPVKKFDNQVISQRDYGDIDFQTVSDHYMFRRSYNVHGLTAKIVGGQDSKFGDWPFVVGIYRNGSFHCGGSIVNSEWILTAAHCTHGLEKFVFEAQVGMLRRHSYSPKEQTRHITEIRVHERYDSKIFMNDIALMKVQTPFHLSKWVTTACLATDVSQDPLEGQECTVIGWGDLAEETSGPDQLQEVKLPVLQKCLETFTKDNLQICAGVLEGGKDACQGDSGGPLICSDSQGRLIVNGLVSFGRGCARPDQAGVYTRISAYTTWIENTINGNSLLTIHPRTCASKCTRDGGECLFAKLTCDGHVNCLAAEDEINCLVRSRASHSYDDADEEAYHDIKRTSHATEEHTHEYGSAKLCGPSEFQCKTTLSCIPLQLKCNGNFDCLDNTDEKHCDCGNIVQNSYPQLVCDGIHHCVDGSDEVDCSIVSNGTYGETKCPLSNTTIDSITWCDGTVDCLFGEDEVDCIRLMKTKGKLPEYQGFLEDKISRGVQSGYVVTREFGGQWKIACREDFEGSMAEWVCPYVGLTIPTPIITRSARSNRMDSGWRIKREPDDSETCHQGKVICGEETKCGLRKLYSLSASVPKADQIGTYPWVAMLMVEGNPVCPGTLVHKQWLLVSSRCIDEHVRSTTTEYLSAIMGFTKTTNIVTSTIEQVKRVNSVVRLLDGLSLLRLENSFTADHFTMPICPTYTLNDGTPTCFRIKLINGTLYDRQVKYDPSCEATGHYCIKYTGRDKCKRSTEYFVYCTEDNFSWQLLGYASAVNVANCSSDGKLILKNPFHGTEGKVTKDILSRPVSTVIKTPGCTGTRCPSGTCVGNKYVCDGIAHCPDGLDERRCQRHYQRLLRSHDDEDDEHTKFQNATISCPLGHFRCQMTGNCVPISAFCDGAYDCGYDDHSDEPEEHLCTCRHYLELAAPETICDPSGESRCPDRSDQLGCPCRPDSFVCNPRSSHKRECIHKYLVCDSVKDCSNGFDEAFCLAVSSSLTNLKMDRSKRTLEGYVLVQVKGSWHPYCSDSWSAEMGEKICRFLGYNNLLNLDDIELDNLENSQNKYESAENDNHDNPLLLLLKDTSRFDTGPIEDVVTKINTDSYSCNVALIKCSKR